MKAMAQQVPSGQIAEVEARAITRPPGHHFFGYYGIPPWNASERLYVCLESEFHERPPGPGDRARIGLVELATGRFESVGSTAAWNLQQGAMLHWLPTAADSHLVFNDLDAAARCFRPVILDISTGTRRVVPAAVGISAVGPDGRTALGLDYARLHSQRPVVGYAGGHDATAGVLHPDDDGVWRIDLVTGSATLVLSHAQALAAAQPVPPLALERPVFFNHTHFNPDGTRFLVFLRYFNAAGRLDSAVLTAGPDGSAVRCIVPWGQAVSHFDWRSPSEALLTVADPGGTGRQYALVRDVPEAGWATHDVLGAGVLTTEGHQSYSPDRRWLVIDGGPDADRRQILRLYDVAGKCQVVLGHFYSAPQFRGDVRCDLHPRWSRTGTQVSFDSVHEGTRQVYVVDVASVTGLKR
jgi:hypothetical protein